MRAAAVAASLALLTAATLMAGRPLSYQEFAQIATGPNIRTTFLVFNPNSENCRVEMTFRDDQGQGLGLDFGWGNGLADAIGIDVFPGDVRELRTDFSESYQAGWASLQADCEVGAQALFEIFVGEQLVTQAAVESPGPIQNADLFVMQKPGTSTGIAIANTTRSRARVQLALSHNGRPLGQPVSLELPPLTQTARFLDQLFEGQTLPDEFTGVLHLSASSPITVTTLQQTGLVLGTLPVIERRNSLIPEGN